MTGGSPAHRSANGAAIRRRCGGTFATRPAYLRDGVAIEDGSDGIFGAILGATRSRRCIVLFEMRRYTRMSQTLATAAVEQGIQLVVICDTLCYWARDYTHIILPLCTDSRLLWNSRVSFFCLNALLLDDIVTHLGSAVSGRLANMRQLQDRFEAFRD